MRISDWSSDVCSSDLERAHLHDKGLVKAEAKTQGLAQLRRGARSQHYGRRVARDHVYHCEEQGDSHRHDGDGEHHSSNQIEPHGSGARLPASRLAERSEEHTSELQSLMRNSYAVFCSTTKT